MTEAMKYSNTGKEMEFIKDGESLDWEQAKEFMIDSTGRLGPKDWELGSYKDGEG